MTFNFRFIESDRTGYYYTNWKEAVPVSIKATSKQEAIEKIKEALGKPRNGYYWNYKLDSITE